MKRNHEIVAMWINEKSVESYTINMSLSFKTVQTPLISSETRIRFLIILQNLSAFVN